MGEGKKRLDHWIRHVIQWRWWMTLTRRSLSLLFRFHPCVRGVPLTCGVIIQWRTWLVDDPWIHGHGTQKRSRGHPAAPSHTDYLTPYDPWDPCHLWRSLHVWVCHFPESLFAFCIFFLLSSDAIDKSVAVNATNDPKECFFFPFVSIMLKRRRSLINGKDDSRCP